MSTKIRSRRHPKAVHERGSDGRPICGELSVLMGSTQEVTCRGCLLRLQDAIATELVRVIGKLQKPPCGGKDRIMLSIRVVRNGQKDSSLPEPPDIIVPEGM